MSDLNTLISLAGAPLGGPFVMLSTVDAALTIPDGVRIGFVSCRSAGSAYALTLPLLAGCPGCALVISAPDGAANAVTVTAAAGGDTVLGGATVVLGADNLLVLFAGQGATNWEGHTGT